MDAVSSGCYITQQLASLGKKGEKSMTTTPAVQEVLDSISHLSWPQLEQLFCSVLSSAHTLSAMGQAFGVCGGLSTYADFAQTLSHETLHLLSEALKEEEEVRRQDKHNNYPY
jgi:hypothetical protein